MCELLHKSHAHIDNKKYVFIIQRNHFYFLFLNKKDLFDMGATISVSRLNTTVDLANDTLQVSTNGNLRESVKDKKIILTLNGKIINTSDASKKITETVRKQFVNYIKSDSFKTFAKNNLLKKAEEFSPQYGFNVMQSSFTDLDWTLNNINLVETDDKTVFDIRIECLLKTSNGDLTFSSTVSHMGQNFIQTINDKLIPVFTINEKNYSFDINKTTFDLTAV